ncbi:GFA family protein [Echinimonas agarilytica]|uniref:GFA family protein n=1 Tax=Echinimonas agarilytica TaxID=1215918 RepID=A0AA41W7V1_9GAMM|nr:GFA family protein [Echinimonas agarilytica]MCM2680805.1 GFA family protein [Echinimonas agarilytica]
MHRGSCLCGAISFEVEGDLGMADACHCQQCRKWTGHFLASVDVPRKMVTINGQADLNWYHSSGKVRRGFCAKCGSSIFFDPTDQQKHNWLAIALGAFDTTTQIQLHKHIFVAEKGDYYSIADGLPQNPY